MNSNRNKDPGEGESKKKNPEKPHGSGVLGILKSRSALAELRSDALSKPAGGGFAAKAGSKLVCDLERGGRP